MSHFWVTFGSLLGHFHSFCVSVELGGRRLHKPSPLPFWVSLLFCLSRNSLLFRVFLPSFPVILGVRKRRKILGFLVVFLAFLERARKGRLGKIRRETGGLAPKAPIGQKGAFRGNFCSSSWRALVGCTPRCCEAIRTVQGPNLGTDLHSQLFLLGWYNLNILKTNPTPNKNDSYGIKVGVRMP